jgi:hypothetical protein
MRIDGQSHKMAVMLATRSFPGVRTDATFNEGRCNGNQFEAHPALGDQYRRIADASGVSTTGKWYCSGLADFPGDPTAWVSDRGDVLRVARLKGYRVSGAVEYDPGPRDPMPDVPIADDILQDAIEGEMEDDPGQRREDVEERMFQLLTGAVDPNPLRVSDPPPEAAFEDGGAAMGYLYLILARGLVLLRRRPDGPLLPRSGPRSEEVARWNRSSSVLHARVERLPGPDPRDGGERRPTSRRPTRPECCVTCSRPRTIPSRRST